MNALSQFIANIVTYIIQPLIGLLFAAALFMLGWGIVVFFDVRGAEPKERARGRTVLLWGIIGFFIMVSGISIIAAATKTFCGTTFCK